MKALAEKRGTLTQVRPLGVCHLLFLYGNKAKIGLPKPRLFLKLATLMRLYQKHTVAPDALL